MTVYHSQLHRLYAEDLVRFHDEFFKVVEKIVVRTARRYPSKVYNYDQNWDTETLRELVQEVYEKRLLDEKSNQLVYIMTEARSIESIERLLTRQTKQVILRRARKTPVDNLMRRIHTMADAGAIKAGVLQGVSYFSPNTTSEVKPVEVTESDLVRATNLAREIPILWGKPDAERESKLYTAEGLEHVMTAILSAVSCISESDLWRILENLLTSFVPSSLYMDEELGDTDVERNSMILMADMDDQIRQFVDALDGRELAVLVAKSQGISDKDTGRGLGFSRQTIDKVKSQVHQKMASVFQVLGSEDSAEVVSRRVIELATVRLAAEEGPR